MNVIGPHSGHAMSPVTSEPPAEEASGQRASRRLRGKALRKACPRSSHADVFLGQLKRDPLKLIEQSDSRLRFGEIDPGDLPFLANPGDAQDLVEPAPPHVPLIEQLLSNLLNLSPLGLQRL